MRGFGGEFRGLVGGLWNCGDDLREWRELLGEFGRDVEEIWGCLGGAWRDLEEVLVGSLGYFQEHGGIQQGLWGNSGGNNR